MNKLFFSSRFIAPVIELARQAGEVILSYWRTDLEVTSKLDNSPVTAADLAAHHLILAGLTALNPSIPVLSEEDADIDCNIRSCWQRWWLVDPLDGTQEFISGSEEFTVNIALIEQGDVVFGVVLIPTSGCCYFGGAGLGAWRSNLNAMPQQIQVRQAPSAGEVFTVVVSRRHSTAEQERLLSGLSETLGELQLENIGSSLKFCLLAEGSADCYPCLAPTSQWDTAAAQGVLEGAGGEVLELNGEPFSYLARESLLNSFFLALPAKAAWREHLLSLARS
ncbi:3'(2'),5'-bisphosphate nucleotidase CysQ [Candidatus Pseudomonas adelgestsugas]|uniref:3'(2'),5'-bisphosphate nucleotidase CysQ n=1 Tax=Candidatus Pseudomonas adelgestsugas TaxID=1302376 RepID=A0ABX5R7A1_9PSED|nr:3'(2'),5'-bisphosphate nucleotidase CysQ [Candidatus Pseudomonas adelgestsugas]QAX81519.1 3'(2'),5'-bisphosphate nucleotidase CysQ [Candidatus Pseudomonas adelgestsugas]